MYITGIFILAGYLFYLLVKPPSIPHADAKANIIMNKEVDFQVSFGNEANSNV